MCPLAPRVLACDPFLTDAGADVELTDLESLVSTCCAVVVAAVPSEETRGLRSADLVARLQPGAMVVLISRTWCADFAALFAAARAGRIEVATDIFPGDLLRQSGNVILRRGTEETRFDLPLLGKGYALGAIAFQAALLHP